MYWSWSWFSGCLKEKGIFSILIYKLWIIKHSNPRVLFHLTPGVYLFFHCIKTVHIASYCMRHCKGRTKKPWLLQIPGSSPDSTELHTFLKFPSNTASALNILCVFKMGLCIFLSCKDQESFLVMMTTCRFSSSTILRHFCGRQYFR